MAALRQAARRLCERSLQRAQGSSPVTAQEQRRLFLHGSSPGHRLMSNSTVTGKPQTSAGLLDELRMEFEEKKQELFNLCLAMRGTGAFKRLSWEDLQNLRLTTHLAAQVKPKPDDPNWWSYRRTRMIFDFITGYFCLGFTAYSLLGGSSKKESEANSEANIVSDSIDPANERMN